MKTCLRRGQSWPQGARRYITNILWTWLGVAVGILIGFVITPYVIRKIGDKQFSIWTLTLSLVEYYWLIDFGLRSATVTLSAEYHTLKNHAGLSMLVNTGSAYSTIGGRHFYRSLCPIRRTVL